MYAIRSYYEHMELAPLRIAQRADAIEQHAHRLHCSKTANPARHGVITSYSIHYTKLYDPGHRARAGALKAGCTPVAERLTAKERTIVEKLIAVPGRPVGISVAATHPTPGTPPGPWARVRR